MRCILNRDRSSLFGARIGVVCHDGAPSEPGILNCLVTGNFSQTAGTTQAASWDLETLLDTLNEMLDLAKVRAVDAELLPLGQLLPAIYLAANPRSDTVSTDLRGILQRSEAIV